MYLLIPSYSFRGDTLFDVEIMQLIVMNFLAYDMEENHWEMKSIMSLIH